LNNHFSQGPYTATRFTKPLPRGKWCVVLWSSLC